MTRGGRVSDREGPERRCLVTGAGQPKGGLVRFVVGPDGALVPDVAGRLPGRGMYLVPDRAVIETAVKKKLFARAARGPVTVPDGLADLVEGLIARRLIATLSLAHKAGQALAGFEKARELVFSGRAAVVVQASDGSERGKTKLRTPPNAAHVGCLSAQELGLSFGRDHVIHAAVAAGGLARRVVEEAARLARLRGQDGGDAVAEE
jgi:predicted RNA-binding protein YlxR (DUF448 family)